MLLSAKVTQKHFRHAPLYQNCLCALPGAFRPADGGRLFAALIPPLPSFLPTAQHCNVYNFCNLAIFKSAIPRLQNSNTLHCCAVALPVRHCLILSSSQYHVLFIRFARTPNSFFAFSSVRFDMPCSSARLKTTLQRSDTRKRLNCRRTVFSGWGIMRLPLMKSWAALLLKQIKWNRRNDYSGNWQKQTTPCRAMRFSI